MDHLTDAEAEHLETHLGLWLAYVQPDANPTEIELWGAVRNACDWLPKLLAERREHRRALVDLADRIARTADGASEGYALGVRDSAQLVRDLLGREGGGTT